MLRDLLLGTTMLRNAPDQPGAGAPAPAAPVVEPVPAQSPESPVGAQEPAAVGEAIPSSPPEAEPAAAAQPEPAAEPAKPAAIDAHAEETLLEAALKEGGAPKPEEPKPDAAAADAKPADGKPGEPAKPAEPAAAAPAPVAYDLKFPDGFQANNEALDGFKKFLGDNKLTPEQGQSLVDMYTKESQRYIDHAAQEQQRVWAETRKGWRDQAKSDDQIGGSGFETSMSAIARMRDFLVPQKHQGAFNEMLRTTGVGDHPEFLRLLHNAAKYLDEPAPPKIVPLPTPNNGQRPGGKGGRLRNMYADNRAARGAN